MLPHILERLSKPVPPKAFSTKPLHLSPQTQQETQSLKPCQTFKPSISYSSAIPISPNQTRLHPQMIQSCWPLGHRRRMPWWPVSLNAILAFFYHLNHGGQLTKHGLGTPKFACKGSQSKIREVPAETSQIKNCYFILASHKAGLSFK